MNLNDVARVVGRRTTWGTGPSGVPRLRDVSAGLVVVACALLIAGCSTSATSGQSSRVQQQPPKGSATPSGSPTLAFQATGTCSHPERYPSPATDVPVSSLQRKLLERPQLPAGWCPDAGEKWISENLKQYQGQAPPPSSNPMCEALDMRLAWPAPTLGPVQVSADYQQDFTATLGGGTSTMYTGEIREILIQFPTAAKASAELHTYTSDACSKWTYSINGTTVNEQSRIRNLSISADESIVREDSTPTEGEGGSWTVAVVRKDSLLAYVSVSPGHPGMSSWPTAALVLPAVADDLNR